MTVQTWKCTVCEKEFHTGQWLGCNGNATLEHRVPAKTYFAREGSLSVTIRHDRSMMGGSGERVSIAGKDAHFLGGTFATTDPETQEVLDRKGYLISKEQYVEMNTPDNMKNARLKATIEEQNKLLEAAKQEAAELRLKLKEKEPEPELAGAKAARR